MYKRWWKVLGAVLVLYTIIAGIAIPVGPGIKSMSYESATAGASAQFHITGYNTHFREGRESLKTFLRIKDKYVCSSEVNVTTEDHMSATFAIPAEASGQYFRLIINNDKDGTFAYKDSIMIKPATTAAAGEMADGFYCEPEVNKNDPSYFSFPYRIILYETIRNLYFHVPMWFTMTFLLLISFITSIGFLRNFNHTYDIVASQCASIAVLFGLLGFATGAWWGNFTWGELDKWLIQDAKVLGAIIGILMYLAYFILRGSLDDEEKRARISAIYNIFAFSMFIVFIYVMPRMTATLHPGSGGNPGFNIYDVSSHMRLVFYPAVLGWILVGLWFSSVRIRMKLLEKYI